MKLIIFLVTVISVMAQTPATPSKTAPATKTAAKTVKPKKPMPKAKTIPPPPSKK